MSTEVWNLRELINEIPGDHGWWHSDSGDVYYDAAIELQADGWEVERILDFLGGLYGAAANEFGG